jgi:hypothetical protein
MKIVKRMIFILFVILLFVTVVTSVVKIIEASKPDPNASGLKLLDGVFESAVWCAFIFCVYEINHSYD